MSVPASRWQTQAACRGVDPELFFPERGASTAAARAVCVTCPVAIDCLEYSLANEEPHGFWGGLSERGRRRIRAAWAAGQPIHHHLLSGEDDDVPGDNRPACDHCGRRYAPASKSQRFCHRACTLAAQRAARSGGTGRLVTS